MPWRCPLVQHCDLAGWEGKILPLVLEEWDEVYFVYLEEFNRDSRSNEVVAQEWRTGDLPYVTSNRLESGLDP